MDELDDLAKKFGMKVPGSDVSPMAVAPRRTLKDLAKGSGFTITSTTGGKHNPGSLHYQGKAIDVRTRDKKPGQVDAFKRQAESEGYRVLDERVRPKGQKVWGGPHLHLEEPRTKKVPPVSPENEVLFEDLYNKFVKNPVVENVVQPASPLAVPPTPTVKAPVAPIGSKPFSDIGITAASPVSTPVSDQLKQTVRGRLAEIATPGIAQAPDELPPTTPTVESAEPVVGEVPQVSARQRLAQLEIKRPLTAPGADAVVGEGEGFTATVSPSEGDNALETIQEDAAGQLARYAGVDIDAARQYVRQMDLQGMAGGKYDPNARLDFLKAEGLKGRQIGIDFGPGDLERVKALDVEVQKAKRRKSTQEATAENQIKQYVEAGEIESVAQLLAAKDVGVKDIKGRPIDQLIQEERDAFQRFQDETVRDPAEAYNRLLQTEQARLAAGESPEALVKEFYAKQNQARIDSVRKDITERYGSFVNREAEKARIEKEYEFRPLARPLEFAKSIGSYVAKLPAKAVQAGLVLSEASIPGLVSDMKASENPVYQWAEKYEKKIDSYKNKDLKDEFLVNELPEAFAQFATQAILAPATGGASLAVPMMESGLAQYKEADKAGAGKLSRLTAATVGALAGVPDVLIKAKFLRNMSPEFQSLFVQKLATSINNRLAKFVGSEEAKELTRATVGTALKNGAFGFGAEFMHERAEDLVNDVLAKATYKPQLTWQEVFSTSPEKMKEYLAAGIVGAFGGSVETATQNMAYDQLVNAESILEEALKSGQITPEQKAKAVIAAENELTKREQDLSGEPDKERGLRVADKKGNEFTVLEDKGEKLKVQDEKGNISVRNTDRLTPINETETPVSPQPASLDSKPLVQDKPVQGKTVVPIEPSDDEKLRIDLELAKAGKPTIHGTPFWQIQEILDKPIEQPSAPVSGEQKKPTAPVTAAEPPIRYHEQRPKGMVDEAPLKPETLEGAKNRIGELETEVQEERRKVDTNPLTGLGSKNAWAKAQPRIEADPEQEIVSFDVNRMKEANDTTSHSTVDDKVLKRLGEVTQQVLKKNDIETRNAFTPGGDELYVALPKGKASQIRDEIETTFGTVELTVEKDYTNTRTGETFKKGDTIPVTLSGEFGSTVAEAEKGLGKRKEASKTANPVKRAKAETLLGITRSWRAGSNQAEIVFESEEQRDLYDYATNEKFKMRGGRDRASSARDVKGIDADALAKRLGIPKADLFTRASAVYDGVRAQMKGVQHGETRKVTYTKPEPKKSAKQRLVEKVKKPTSVVRERFEKKARTESQTFPEFLKERIGDNWYVSDRPVKRRDEAGTKRIKHSDYKKLEAEFKAQTEADGGQKESRQSATTYGTSASVVQSIDDLDRVPISGKADSTKSTPESLQMATDEDTADRRIFRKDIRKTLDGTIGRFDKPQVLRETPKYLRKLGLNAGPIQMPQSVVAKAVKKHGIAPEVLERLGEEIKNPIAVFESLENPSDRVILTSLTNSEGLPVVAAISKSSDSRQVNVNVIPSAHGKTQNRFFVDWISKGKLLLASKEKSQQWLRRVGLQLPEAAATKLTDKSVERIGENVNKDSLQMVADESSLQRFTDVQFAHTQTVLEGAKSEVKTVAGATVLELNEEAAELARRVWGSAANKDIGPFYGATHTSVQLRRFAKEANAWAAKYEEKGYTKDQVKSLRRMASDFLTLANQAHGVTYIFDFALPHETHHKLVLDALGGKAFPKEALSNLEALDIWNANPTIKTPDGVEKSFNSAYPRLSKQAKAFEMAAMLETGEIQHADKDKFLQIFADGILDVTTDLDPIKFARIIQYGNTQTSDTGREGTERPDAEPIGRVDEPASEAGEGTRDRTENSTEGDGGRTADDAKPRNEKERKVASFSRILGQEYFYDPQSHEDTEVIAAQLISDKGTQAAIHDALYGTPSAEGIRVVHWELERLTGALDNAIREGNKAEIAAFSEAAADLSAKIVQRQVAGGQEVEIAKMLVPLSPEAALLTAQKMVEYAKGEGSTLTPDQTATVIRLAKELKDARADIAKQDKKVKTLEKKIDQLKEDRPTTKTPRMLKQYQKRKPVLLKELADLFPEASVFNGEVYADESLKMAAPATNELTDEQYSKLVEYAAGEVLENKPYKTLLAELDQFTGNETLSKDVHAEAISSLRADRPGMTEEAKEILKTRNEHYREADKILKPKGQNQNVKPQIDKNFKKLNDQNVREMSRLAQRVWAKTGDPLITLAVERLHTDPKTINEVIKDIQKANPGMSLADATGFARKAKQMATETQQEMDAERDQLRGILPDQRKALMEARVAKQKATMKLNKFLANLADDSNAIKRFNNDMRAKFVSNWGTQAFNVIQSTVVTNPTEALLDLFTVGLKTTGLNIGNTPDINLKDILLPMKYIFANNRQMAEFTLSEFPDQFFQVHTGLLGDIDIEPVNLAENKTNKLSKAAHQWFDWNQRLNNKLAMITGAKLQEMHFRNAMVAGTFDQIIRRKSDGSETLESAIENGALKKYISEEDANFAASKALRVTFAAQIDDRPGKFMKRAYDKLDSFVPIFLNPVTYARFTYTTTKVMVANPILFGVLDAQALGGKGYDTRSLASGILGWAGIAVAYGLMANFGGDDDEWHTLKFGDTVFDVRRTFPLSTYFFMAHLIKNFKDGKPTPTGKELLEGFASLETDYFTYGAGAELATGLVDKTKEWSGLGPSGARLAGNFFAGYLRFFKPMRDVLAQFDEEANKLRFYNNTGQDKFVQEISKSLPIVARAYGAEAQKDATGKDIGMPFPAGRLVGINIVHPSFLKPEQSTATKWAMKLFPFAGAGGEMSAENRKAYQMRRTLKNAVRRGTPQSEIQGQLQAYRKQFGERSFGRLKDELSMSELVAKIKYDFGASQEKDVKALQKVWRFATDAEKADLRKILREKKNRTVEFNREFGL